MAYIRGYALFFTCYIWHNNYAFAFTTVRAEDDDFVLDQMAKGFNGLWYNSLLAWGVEYHSCSTECDYRPSDLVAIGIRRLYDFLFNDK
jgi:hypothetical protein